MSARGIFFSHWLRKTFKGRIVETSQHSDGGTLRRYRSGYIDLLQPDGSVIDIVQDLYLSQMGLQDWRVYRTNGGGALTLMQCTREQAMKEAAANVGPVIYVDDRHGFIFCRDTTQSTLKSA